MTRTMRHGFLVAVVHVAIVGSLGATLLVERSTQPRVWTRTMAVDPDAPIRGRYVSVRLEVALAQDADSGLRPAAPGRPASRVPLPSVPVELSVQSNRLVAVRSPGAGLRVREAQRAGERVRVLERPIAYFIPEHAADPSRRAPGEELWAEVTVPRRGAPRPIRLGVKRDGVLTPLTLTDRDSP